MTMQAHRFKLRAPARPGPAPTLKVYAGQQLAEVPQAQALPETHRFAMRVVARVLPIRVNQ